MDNILKDVLRKFVVWTKLKVKIHLSESKAYPKVKEIWWASLGQNIGVEINGKNETFERPVLVMKVFNKDSSLVAPISSKINSGKYLFEFTNSFNEKNIINLSQLRTVSSKRFIRKVGEIDNLIFDEVKRVIKDFFL